MPWPKTLGLPAARANSSSVWIGLKSPEAPAERGAGVDGFHVLELLLAVEQPPHVELDGTHAAARRPLAPVRDGHEEGGRRERLVAREVGIVVLDGARELADLAVLDAHAGL